MRGGLGQLTAVVRGLVGREAGREVGTEAGRDGVEPADRLDRWRTRDWHAALLDLPLDERTYEARFRAPRAREIEDLWAWWTGAGEDPDGSGAATRPGPVARGYLGVYLLTLVAVHCSDRVRFHGDARREVTVAGVTAEDLSRRLVADPAVRRALVALHAPAEVAGRTGSPAERERGERARREWDGLDLDSLEFYRHGTTSFILTGRCAEPVRGRTVRFALKCVIHPYLALPAIAEATRGYASEHGQPDATEGSPAAPVWASHDSWILMDLIEGPTLEEYLAHRSTGRPDPAREILRPVDTEALRQVGAPLLRALAELEGEGRRHDDLAPSNIIVGTDGAGGLRLRFVDLGVNHLHSRSIPGALPGDGAYVAPEVRQDGTSHRDADLYSLGMLLVAIAGIPHTADGTVPDQFYVASVGLARLLEDLTDADPRRRLLVVPVDPARNRFEQILRVFEDEVEILEQDGRDRPRGRFQRVRDLSPGAGTVGRQRRMLQVRSAQAARATGTAAHVVHLRQARRLRRWAWACAVLLWGVTALALTWWSRDLGLSWQARWFDVLDDVSGRVLPDLAFLDDVRSAGSPVPDLLGNLPVRLVTVTFALVCARLYLNVFAEVSTIVAPVRGSRPPVRAVVAEAGLRSLAVLPAFYALVPTLLHRDLWPVFTFVGILTVALVVQACLGFAHDANERARAAGLSSVPRGEVPTLGRLEGWQPVVALYLVPVAVIGTLLMLDVVQDELVYAGFVSLINVGIFYLKSAGTDAPMIRAGLGRAVLAAERLERLRGETRRAERDPR